MALLERPKDIESVRKLLDLFPVVAILGARQVGKTTLARLIGPDHFFDLEDPIDAERLVNPQYSLAGLEGLVVIDEVQRAPGLFEILRVLVDRPECKQKYLILGSASRDLIRQSSESLAGRIGYHWLSGLSLEDVGNGMLRRHWLRGGFPRSFLAEDDAKSYLWRANFVTTFLERDIPQLGISIPAQSLRRFWVMVSHYHGQVLNFAELARSLGIGEMTVRRYAELLEGTFMVRLLRPWHTNSKKRQVKRPKLYIRDSGLYHSLSNIETPEQLEHNPRLGASWEGFAIEQVVQVAGKRAEELFFYREHSGAEIDLYFEAGGRKIGVEFKFQDVPAVSRSMRGVLSELGLDSLFVVTPGGARFRLDERIHAVPLGGFSQALANTLA